MPNLIGQTVGQYRVMQQIGRGGMATVYKAFQPAMERYVAIKVLPEQLAQDPTFIERFRQEARAIARLEHPHILPVYDYGEENGLTYMVMRYMDSGTLAGRLKKLVDVAEAVRLLGQVAEAMDYTHSRGIVHRDIKPSNILIDARGEALLTDFGIARMVEGTQGLTSGNIIGTPTYMSPEQAQGHPVDGRSDIYSLGVILYEALVGRPPFEAETPVAVLMKHVHAPLPLPRAIKPEIDEIIEQVILKALAKDPADRYQTGGEMKRAMESALASAGQGLTHFSPPAAAPTPSSTSAAQTTSPVDIPASPHPAFRRPIIGSVLLLALVIGLILTGRAVFLAFQANDPDRPVQTAETSVAGTDRPAPGAMTKTPTGSPETIGVDKEATPHDEPIQVTDTPAPTPTSSPSAPTATAVAIATVAPALPPTPIPIEPLAAVNITGNPGISDHPKLAFDGEGILHLVWWDTSLGKVSGDFLHRQMMPDGQWSEAENLTTDFELIIGGDSLRLVHNPAGAICVFWRAAKVSANPATIGFYRRCLSGGLWSPAEMILRGRGNMRDFTPAFAPDGTVQTLYIINIGDLFLGDFELSDGFKVATRPDLAIDQAGGYHAVWVRQGDPFTIEYRYSGDNGQTWQEAESLTDEASSSGGVVGPLSLKADEQGNVHLVFVSQARGIFYRRWTPVDGWGPSVELTQGERNSGSTSLGLAIDSEGLAHVVWQGAELFYTGQQPDATWSKPRLIAEVLNSGPGPEVAVDDQGVRHFVWQVEDDAVDLYYASLP